MIDSGYRRKRVYAWITAVSYLVYALAPIKIYYGEVLDTYQVVILVIFSVGCFFLSFFLIKAYPSEKTIQGLNGKMLKVEGSKYNDI